jgi:uncharacterized protein
MMTPGRPEVFELDARDVRAILARNHVGRLAFTWGGEVEIRPLHYVLADSVLYGRTSHGAKFVNLETLPTRIAFEVDEIESVFRWKSVLVRGTFSVLFPDGTARDEWAFAVARLRTLVRDTFDADDPVPERSVVFRIEIDEATGRACR